MLIMYSFKHTDCQEFGAYLWFWTGHGSSLRSIYGAHTQPREDNDKIDKLL